MLVYKDQYLHVKCHFNLRDIFKYYFIDFYVLCVFFSLEFYIYSTWNAFELIKIIVITM